MTRLARLLPICLVLACSETPVASAPPAPSASPSSAPVAAPAPAAAVDFGLPFAKNGDELFEGVPTVVVDREHVMLDGKVLADVPTLAALGKLQKIDAEFEALKDKREAWRSANPGKPLPGVAFLKMHRATKAIVVKDVFQVAAFAAYPNLAFVVETADKKLALMNADANVPDPFAAGPSKNPDPVLFVHLAPPSVVLTWKRGAEKLSEVEMPWSEAFQRDGEIVRAPALAQKLGKEWAAQGAHRDPADLKLDKAVLLADDETELRDIVATLDALAETKREIAKFGKRVPVFIATLSMLRDVPANGSPDGPRPRVSLGVPKVSGRLPPEVVMRVVRGNFDNVATCFMAGLKQNPKLKGSMTAAFTIGADGKVTKTADKGSDLADKSVVQCMLKVFGALTFPAPESGSVTVVYPISFGAGG